MRYRLRTLLILLAVGPPLLAGAFFLLPMVPLGISARGMQVGFCVWLGVVVSAIVSSLYSQRRTGMPANAIESMNTRNVE